jgi:cytochrome c-type biogenesis protein CcmH
LALAGGGLALWMQNRRRSASAAAAELSKLTAEEEARLEALIAAEPASDKPG